MANRKLKNFEFANFAGKENVATTAAETSFFECVNGSVFLICEDESHDNPSVSPSSIASQRIKYYLENEFVQNPANALSNALIYTNGFIYEYARKNEGFSDKGVHGSFVLYRDGKVYYAAIGEAVIYYFFGRKLLRIADGTTGNAQHSDSQDKTILLGVNKNFKPAANLQPLVPINDDLLLLCSKSFTTVVSEKSLANLLSDPMPLQTKLNRLVDMGRKSKGAGVYNLQLISFYNLENAERSFEQIPSKKKLSTKPVTKSESGTVSASDDSLWKKLTTPPLKYILIVLAGLLVLYMFYDIFFSGQPILPNQNQAETQLDSTIQASDEISDALVSDNANKPENNNPDLPKDIEYQIVSGDTWGSIYATFGVCSWFIRTHEANKGSFDTDENPVAGRRIFIPVVFSGKKEFNPYYYHEFSLAKTGTRCENVDEEFQETFLGKYSQN